MPIPKNKWFSTESQKWKAEIIDIDWNFEKWTLVLNFQKFAEM